MGGLMDNAFKYAEKHWIDTEETYPYVGWSFGGCKYQTDSGVVEVQSYYDVVKDSPD